MKYVNNVFVNGAVYTAITNNCIFAGRETEESVLRA